MNRCYATLDRQLRFYLPNVQYVALLKIQVYDTTRVT